MLFRSNVFEPVSTGVAMVKVAYELYPEDVKWKQPPYEYVYDRNPFDVIAGTSRIRENIEAGRPLEDLFEGWSSGVAEFKTMREPYLLY